MMPVTTSDLSLSYPTAKEDHEDTTTSATTTTETTTMLSVPHNTADDHRYLWKYHEALFEATDARNMSGILATYRKMIDRLKIDINNGVAETSIAEGFCQKLADVTAFWGESIRPIMITDDETEIIDLENDGVVEVAARSVTADEATAAATAESITSRHQDEVVVEPTKPKPSKGEPPVTYISFPNAEASREAVYVLHKQQTAMSNVLLSDEFTSCQNVASKLKRSLELVDRLEYAEALYQDIVKQESKVQTLWEKYCRLAETVLPARATNETIERSMGDVWLAELAYRQAANAIHLSPLQDVLEELVEAHTRRRVNVWKATERRAFREPSKIFETLEELHVDTIEELELEDTATDDVTARMKQIAEFHGTTTLPDDASVKGVDVDTYLGKSFDTDDEEEDAVSMMDEQRHEQEDELEIALDKTSKSYSHFMNKFLLTSSLLESHFIKFSAVAGSISGKESTPSRTALLIITNDDFLHIFNLGTSIPMLAAPQVAIRHLSKTGLSAETSISLSACQIRATRSGVKITNKSGGSRRGYKFVLQNEADRQQLLQAHGEEHGASTIACV